MRHTFTGASINPRRNLSGDTSSASEERMEKNAAMNSCLTAGSMIADQDPGRI
jgi:hypothetical protein